tara:strand:- start:27173 stop:27901 length:729 start_codon:yes stop_codon:yes gene_type:complete
MDKQDDVYIKGNLSGLPFSFNKEVTGVFEDMISRSVPGYQSSLNLIKNISSKYITNDSLSYDLGCSLGASSKAILEGSRNIKSKLISIDNSPTMIEACKHNFSKEISKGKVSFVREDISEIEFQPSSFLSLNYVLQFLPLLDRDNLIRKIHYSLTAQGGLLISEKINLLSKKQNDSLIRLHHGFKSAHGYSELEISSKRDALEGVLITETEEDHLKRFKSVGFTTGIKLMQNLNFITYLFLK